MPKTTESTHYDIVRKLMDEAIKKKGGEVEIPEMTSKWGTPLTDNTVRSMITKSKINYTGHVFVTRKSRTSGKMFLQARRD